MGIMRSYSVDSIRKTLGRGGQRMLWGLLRLLGVPTRSYPRIYEWMMGFPAGWTLPSGSSQAPA